VAEELTPRIANKTAEVTGTFKTEEGGVVLEASFSNQDYELPELLDNIRHRMQICVCIPDQWIKKNKMKNIETDFIHISILDTKTVLVEAMEGVDINLEKSKYANQLIANEMSGNYGMIIDRKADYSIVPVDVYNVLNSFKRLKAIAIVVHNKKSYFPVSAEQQLYKGKLEVFQTISQAHKWLEEILGESERQTTMA